MLIPNAGIVPAELGRHLPPLMEGFFSQCQDRSAPLISFYSSTILCGRLSDFPLVVSNINVLGKHHLGTRTRPRGPGGYVGGQGFTRMNEMIRQVQSICWHYVIDAKALQGMSCTYVSRNSCVRSVQSSHTTTVDQLFYNATSVHTTSIGIQPTLDYEKFSKHETDEKFSRDWTLEAPDKPKGH